MKTAAIYFTNKKKQMNVCRVYHNCINSYIKGRTWGWISIYSDNNVYDCLWYWWTKSSYMYEMPELGSWEKIHKKSCHYGNDK
jgi:hypothetical protein